MVEFSQRMLGRAKARERLPPGISYAGNRVKEGLVFLSEVRALLDFEHLNVVRDVKTVTAVHEEDDITSVQGGRFQIPTLPSEKIDFKGAFANEQRFHRVVYGARNLVVSVGL